MAEGTLLRKQISRSKCTNSNEALAEGAQLNELMYAAVKTYASYGRRYFAS